MTHWNLWNLIISRLFKVFGSIGTHLLMYPFIHLPSIPLLISSFVCSFTCSFLHSSAHPSIHLYADDHSPKAPYWGYCWFFNHISWATHHCFYWALLRRGLLFLSAAGSFLQWNDKQHCGLLLHRWERLTFLVSLLYLPSNCEFVEDLSHFLSSSCSQRCLEICQTQPRSHVAWELFGQKYKLEEQSPEPPWLAPECLPGVSPRTGAGTGVRTVAWESTGRDRGVLSPAGLWC